MQEKILIKNCCKYNFSPVMVSTQRGNKQQLQTNLMKKTTFMSCFWPSLRLEVWQEMYQTHTFWQCLQHAVRLTKKANILALKKKKKRKQKLKVGVMYQFKKSKSAIFVLFSDVLQVLAFQLKLNLRLTFKDCLKKTFPWMKAL